MRGDTYPSVPDTKAWIVLVPTAAFAQAVIAGTVKDSSGAVLPGVTVEAASPALIEKGPHGGQRRHRAVPHRRPAARHLHGHLHADGVQHVQARRHRADRLVHGDHQRRPQGRHARGNDHGHRRNPGRRRPEREAGDDAEQRRPQGHPDRPQLQRHGRRRARRRHQPERRRDGNGHDAVSDPRRPQQRGPHDGGRAQHREPAGRQSAAGLRRGRRQRAGSLVHDLRAAWASRRPPGW